MAMKKYADGEGSLEVLRGHEAAALDKLESRFGKRLADFDDDERSELHKELDSARKQNKEDAKAESESVADDKDEE